MHCHKKVSNKFIQSRPFLRKAHCLIFITMGILLQLHVILALAILKYF